MKIEKKHQNREISRRLNLVLDQLESLTIFDKNSGYKKKNSKTVKARP